MKVLFVGGTGIISSGVSPLLVERGMDLTLLNRGTRPEMFPRGARHLAVDVRDDRAVRDALKGQSFDVVVSWLVYTPAQLEQDIERFRGRTGQYVLISSASAYQKPPVGFPITESTPLANPFFQYSRDKIACEDRLVAEMRETGFPMTIVRPSFTYGLTMIPAGYQSWERPWTTVERMRRGKKTIVHGDGTSLWTMTDNRDFARAFAGLLGNPRAIGQAVHITSDEVLTWNQVYQAIGRAAGVEPELVHVPSDFISEIDPDARGPLLGDKAHSAVFDNSKIKDLVPGWVATIPFAEGVRRSVEWFDADARRRTVDEAFDARADRIIQAWDAVLRQARPDR